MSHADLVVVGGGITGLAAAWEGVRQGAEVVLFEAGDQVGGKLRTSPVAGVPLDESADAFLARVPEAVTLCAELGLETELVSPATGRAHVWVDDALRPLPEAQLLGVPTDVDAIAATGILSPEGLAQLRSLYRTSTGGEISRTPEGDGGEDESVGALVRRQLGDEVLDRLVAPLVGGIWAGDCDRLSVQTATPALAEARDRSPSLVEGAALVRADALAAAAAGDPATPRPVFLAPRGGMGQLVAALVAALGDRVHTGHPVASIEPGPSAAGPGRSRWQVGVRLDATHSPVSTSADAVVLATPAFAAAPLVAPLAPGAAATLAAVEYASVVLVALAVPREGLERPLDGSGFLVPPSAGRLLTACSWTTSKWPHLAADAGDVVLLRASAGRDGDDRALALDDTKLVDALLADLADTMALRATPVDVRVTRWPGSFPQPRPGHRRRVAALDATLAHRAPGLHTAGAWSTGIGIPACIRTARSKARQALTS